MPEPFARLLRIRQLEALQSRRELSMAIGDAREASIKVGEAREKLGKERQAAEMAPDDATVEAYARWLPIGQAALVAAEEAYVQREAAVDRCRAIQAASDAAVEIASSLLNTELTRIRRSQRSVEQSQADDLASNRQFIRGQARLDEL